MKYICNICGYDELPEPLYTGNICRCCGFQSGHSDSDRGYTPETWREEWIEEGMPWRGSAKKPANWNPLEQLKNLAAENSE